MLQEFIIAKIQKGIKSSEFWVTALTLIGMVSQALPPAYAPYATALSIAYTAGRTYIKKAREAGQMQNSPDLPAIEALRASITSPAGLNAVPLKETDMNFALLLQAFSQILPMIGQTVETLHPDNTNESLKINMGTTLISSFLSALTTHAQTQVATDNTTPPTV
jgi:hypothetical protein